MEQFGTRARSQLSGTIDSSTTTVSIDSATNFPTSGNFSILIDEELMRVTSVSGTDLTVVRGQEGTTADDHTSGALVTCVVTTEAMDNLNYYQGPSTDAYTFRKLTVSNDNMTYIQDSQASGNLSLSLNLRCKIARVLIIQDTNITSVVDGDIPGISVTYDPQNFNPVTLITYDIETDGDFNWIKIVEAGGPTTIYQHDSSSGNRRATGHVYFAPGTGSKTYKITIDVGSTLTVKKATLSVMVLGSDHMTSDELSTGDGGGEGRGSLAGGGGGE